MLKRLEDRNKNQDQPNGLFASHPLIKDRIDNIGSTIAENKLAASATVAGRYSKTITLTAKPLAEVPVIEGTRGLTGGNSKSSDSKASAAPKEKDPKPPSPSPSRRRRAACSARSA